MVSLLSSYLRIADNIEEGNDIGATGQVLENLDLTLDLLFLDGLQDLDAALFVVDSVEAFKDLGVLAASDLAHDLVVVLDTVVMGDTHKIVAKLIKRRPLSCHCQCSRKRRGG